MAWYSFGIFNGGQSSLKMAAFCTVRIVKLIVKIISMKLCTNFRLEDASTKVLSLVKPQKDGYFYFWLWYPIPLCPQLTHPPLHFPSSRGSFMFGLTVFLLIWSNGTKTIRSYSQAHFRLDGCRVRGSHSQRKVDGVVTIRTLKHAKEKVRMEEGRQEKAGGAFACQQGC